jgi:hypothetical protein
MAEIEMKPKARFKKLRETLENVEQQEKVRAEKASICDKMMEIYRNSELDLTKKSEMFIQVLSSAPNGDQ